MRRVAAAAAAASRASPLAPRLARSFRGLGKKNGLNNNNNNATIISRSSPFRFRRNNVDTFHISTCRSFSSAAGNDDNNSSAKKKPAKKRTNKRSKGRKKSKAMQVQSAVDDIVGTAAPVSEEEAAESNTPNAAASKIQMHRHVQPVYLAPDADPVIPLGYHPQLAEISPASFDALSGLNIKAQSSSPVFFGLFADEGSSVGVYCELVHTPYSGYPNGGGGGGAAASSVPSHADAALGKRVLVRAHHRVEAAELKSADIVSVKHITFGDDTATQDLLLNIPTSVEAAHRKEIDLVQAYVNEIEMRMLSLGIESARSPTTTTPSNSSANDELTHADYSAYADECAFALVHHISQDNASHRHQKYDFQSVLSTYTLVARLNVVVQLADRISRVDEFQKMIHESSAKQMSEEHKKFILQQQLKNIKKELGVDGGSEKDALIAKYEARVAAILGADFESKEFDDKDALASSRSPDEIGAMMSAGAKAAIRDEMVKLKMLEKHSPEFNVTRNYLEWLTSLPYGIVSEENYDVSRAREILDEDHYGMKDAKDRILEFIAVGKLRGAVQGKIICFVGPPGVGKTSIGKSIARALDREFYRFSVGGLSDSAEIKGHRRTYVGAMPGKIVQGLKTTGVSNPLVLIDEIDKLGKGYQGDPASALLELLDPAQNAAFTDHYLDVPIDLSKVLFVCTANSLDTIPGPLMDRLEILELSGYDYPEKIAIAKRYLEPRARAETGLDSGEVEIDETAVEKLARSYAREAGVRTLQQYVERVYRKIALQVVQSSESESKESSGVIVTPDNLEKYAGKPKYTSDRMYENEMPAGIVLGLAWNGMGGAALYVETAALKRESTGDAPPAPIAVSLKSTGKMGDVMKESTSLALANARRQLQTIQPDNRFFLDHEIFMHVPEGGTPKEGPSAGCAMTVALLSLALNSPVRGDLAMTGEISLTGRVLPVGGIREKVIAARRSGVASLVLPRENENDFEELEAHLKENLDVTYADTLADVLRVALPDVAAVLGSYHHQQQSAFAAAASPASSAYAARNN